MSNHKEFSHKKCTQWEDSIYNYLSSRKNSRCVSLSYATRKYTPSTDDGENRDVMIIHQASLLGNMFIRYSMKEIDILKELTLITDTETWIKGLKCRKRPCKSYKFVMMACKKTHNGEKLISRFKENILQE